MERKRPQVLYSQNLKASQSEFNAKAQRLYEDTQTRTEGIKGETHHGPGREHLIE